MSNCNTNSSGQPCSNTSGWNICKPWDITKQLKTNCLADSYLQETLDIAGAQVNVHKLLGIYEQTKLVDLTGNGNAISSGDSPGFPATNAFDTIKSEWRSKQTGQQVIDSGYIGYNFGVIKLPSNRERYGVQTGIYYEITTIKIKQSNNPQNRSTKARVERSDDGINWIGVAIIQLPDDNKLNTINFKNSSPSKFWRLRPIFFNGDQCDSWGIQALEMHEYSATTVSNIQDKIFLENRDREYNQLPTTLKGYYELSQANTDLRKFGIEIDSNYNIKVNFNSCVAAIGRPIVIGDIIELPSETQYTPELNPIKRYLEVTDVTWDSSSYTPGWLPTMLLLTAMPALASQETRDIFGDIAHNIDSSGLFNDFDKKWQDFTEVDHTIKIQAKKDVPELGSEGSHVIREFNENEITIAANKGINISKFGLDSTGLYIEDAIPQNNASYTEGPTFPLSPTNGEYHRLTYEGLAKDVPARLYRYSEKTSRWIYLETDKRAQHNFQKTTLDEYLLGGSTRISAREIK